MLPLDEGGALPLGILEDQEYRQATVVLEPGDLLLLYTDGITEARGPLAADGSRPLLGLERLDRLLCDCGGAGAEECVARVRAEVAAFSDNTTPADDQTLIAIRCTA